MASDLAPIALIGFRGTGKTTIARLLALRLGYDWIDADVEIELHAGKSIAAIFAEDGEDSFRDRESDVLSELCSRKRAILALGGGAVLRESNRNWLTSCRDVVWLQASATTIEKRLTSDPSTEQRRPNLTNRGGLTEIRKLLTQREPIYRACATLVVDTEDRDPDEIADEIARVVSRED